MRKFVLASLLMILISASSLFTTGCKTVEVYDQANVKDATADGLKSLDKDCTVSSGWVLFSHTTCHHELDGEANKAREQAKAECCGVKKQARVACHVRRHTDATPVVHAPAVQPSVVQTVNVNVAPAAPPVPPTCNRTFDYGDPRDPRFPISNPDMNDPCGHNPPLVVRTPERSYEPAPLPLPEPYYPNECYGCGYENRRHDDYRGYQRQSERRRDDRGRGGPPPSYVPQGPTKTPGYPGGGNSGPGGGSSPGRTPGTGGVHPGPGQTNRE